jgi:V8-like Glu-specific endopeptidase
MLHSKAGALATAVTAQFGYEDDGAGHPLSGEMVLCNVATIVDDQAYDWGVIRAAQPLKAGWPIVKLSEAGQPVVNDPAFIIQHPGADSKRLGFVRNQVSSFDDRVVQYLTDTQQGSSGSPVFDSQGRLIALHHAGGRPQEFLGRAPVKKNEGIRISRVVEGLAAKHVATP